MDAPVIPDLDSGGDNNFPWVAVGIGKIPRISTIIGAMRGLLQPRTLSDSERQHLIDFAR